MKNHIVFIGILLFVSVQFACDTKTKEGGNDAPVSLAIQEQPAKTSARPAHWGYEGDLGPEKWANLDPVYSKCGDGLHQSPIDIEQTDVEGGVKLKLDYKAVPSFRIAHTEHMEDIIDNGHTIQVTVDEGSVITVEGKMYDLKQFHFHTPSEHTIDEKHFPMEMHMVHQSADKQLAVVSVLFEEGPEQNNVFNALISVLPDTKGETMHVRDTKLNIRAKLPVDNYVYHYIGSLTTPPCSENVQWLVMRDRVQLSSKQIEAFATRIGDNNRPVQALNDRVVKMDDISLAVD